MDCSIRATCPAHLSRLDLRLLIILGEEYNGCSSSLCNFLYPPVISCFLAPNIFLSSLLYSRTPLICTPLKVRDQVSQPYNTTGNIIVLCLNFQFLKAKETIKFSQVNNNMHFPLCILRLISS